MRSPRWRIRSDPRRPQVSSIVDFGVELFATAMLADPTSVALIFGTDTTAKVAAHRDALALRGVSPDRVVMKGCPKLATNIQGKGADSAEADALLGKFVHEAWTVMAEGGGLHDTPAGLAPVLNVYAGMCCTHYGYRRVHRRRHAGAARRAVYCSVLRKRHTLSACDAMIVRAGTLVQPPALEQGAGGGGGDGRGRDRHRRGVDLHQPELRHGRLHLQAGVFL